MNIDRRNFLKKSLLGFTTSLGIPFSGVMQEMNYSSNAESVDPEGLVIDTNVHVHSWPSRNLKYGETSDMVDKLRKHGVSEAWAGSYDALFHKNIDSVNARLIAECKQYGEGFLVPFGTVNPRWPDWEEDLRRCDEEYGMSGIRLYPGFQNYTLDLPEFTELLERVSERGMIVQIAVAMSDERMQHPELGIPVVDCSPLPDILKEISDVEVQLLNPFRHVRKKEFDALLKNTDVSFGISNLDGTGGLGRLINGEHWYISDLSVPADRLLIGSHVPYRPVENVLFKLLESPLDKDDALAIMSKNANRMLKKDGISFKMI